jgi:hypothetical protein
VTVREGRQVVLCPQLAAAAPAAQSINASSADVGPSLADQLRARAHCHQHSQLKEGSSGSLHRRQLPRYEAFSPLAKGSIPDPGAAEHSAPSSSPTCITDLAAAFPDLVEQSSRGTWAVTTVKAVRRRRQTGAWFRLLLRSYLSQCDTFHREDHHLRVEGDEVPSRRSKVVGLQSGYRGAARPAEDASGRIQLSGVEVHEMEGG